jgi:hypothetical protein
VGWQPVRNSRATHQPETGDEHLQRRTPLWLWLSVPIAALAIAGSVVGIVFDHSIYSKETANWAAQSVGQDIANLVAFPALLALAFAAARGSLRAYLGWIGILVYSVYTYAIYTFDVHFGPLFLVWVGVFGLSIYTLIAGLAAIDPVRVKSRFTGRAPIRFTSVLLVGIGSVFYLLWLSEIIPAMIAGTTPEALREVGLPTNPVHVLDLAVFLPSTVVAGVFLSKRRVWGYVLAPVMLVAMAFLGLGIVSLMTVTAARGLDTTAAVGVAIAVLAFLESVVVIRFLRSIDRDAKLHDVFRPALDERRADLEVVVGPSRRRQGVGV